MKLINAQNFWNDGDNDKNNDKQQPYDDIPVCLAEEARGSHRFGS